MLGLHELFDLVTVPSAHTSNVCEPQKFALTASRRELIVSASVGCTGLPMLFKGTRAPTEKDRCGIPDSRCWPSAAEKGVSFFTMCNETNRKRERNQRSTSLAAMGVWQ
jgi:hypothetical protein